MLSAFVDHVSLDQIPGHRLIIDANTITTIPSDEVQPNGVCGYRRADGWNRRCAGVKPDSILIVLYDLIFLDQIVGRTILYANTECRVAFTSIVPDGRPTRRADNDSTDYTCGAGDYIREHVIVFDDISVAAQDISDADSVAV